MINVLTKGVTSQIFTVTLRSATTGQRLGGVLYSAVTINTHRQGASVSSISPVTMTTGTWVSGGWVETSVTGVYQFGAPNAALAAGAEFVKFSISTSGAIDKDIDVVLIDADLRNATSLGLANLNEAVGSRLASGSYTAPPTVGDIRTELETNGGLLDQVYDVASGAEAAASAASVSAASVDTKLSTGRLTKVDTLPDTGTVATTGAAMTLQTGERTSIASAVRTNLATELARIDTNIDSRSTYSGTDTAGTTTLLARLTSTRAGNLDNLNASVSDLATAVATIATVLDGIKGAGWTNETLKAIFAKEVEASIGEEQIAEISGEISAALAGQGITVAEFAAEALAQLVSVKAISLISPFTAIGDLVLQIGDDYLAADETSLDWSNAAGSWGDLTDCEIEFRSSRVVDQVEQPNAVVAGSVLVASGPGQKVRVELPSSWTLQLSPGAYAYQLVRITAAGKERTLRRGSITALRKVGVPS